MHIRIKERRLQLSLTQEALAKMLSVSRVSITKWETRVTEPDGENLQALAKVLEVSPEWLLYGELIRSRCINYNSQDSEY
ncbi:helix-turn-helix domain-containing protein [Proteus mirabilis]|uniref:helix-turn-helix domain-containing protein n=1 Tax=Proteus mirabilis TaxID=584 RepID=UPI001EF20C7F|nr:helix-turn-helix domain-containing protein [Proteus mirabilis]